MENNSKFKISTFLTVILIFTFLIFNFAQAAQAGLVPCGPGKTKAECQWEDFFQLAKNIIDFLMYIVIPLATVMIVAGGIFILTAGDSTSRVAKGKEIITSAVVGLLIALLSWLVIDTIIKIVAVGWDGLEIGPWNKLK